MRCAECGVDVDDQARGWRAMIGEEDDGSLMVATYCAGCHEREFGDPEIAVDLAD